MNSFQPLQAIGLPWRDPPFSFDVVLQTIIGKGRTARGVMRALTWNARHVRATMAARSIVQRSRQTPDRDILKRMFKGNRKLSLLFSVGIPRVKEGTAST